METLSASGGTRIAWTAFETSSEGWKLQSGTRLVRQSGPFETSSEGWKLWDSGSAKRVMTLSKLPLRDGNGGYGMALTELKILSKLPLRDGNLERWSDDSRKCPLSKLPLRDGNRSATRDCK